MPRETSLGPCSETAVVCAAKVCAANFSESRRTTIQTEVQRLVVWNALQEFLASIRYCVTQHNWRNGVRITCCLPPQAASEHLRSTCTTQEWREPGKRRWMAEAHYPRDLRGYGRNPPDPKWPGAARVVVQFVLNFEEGGENNILHGDLASEAFLSDVLGAQPWQGTRHANVESMFEYGSRAGFWRLWRMFTSRKIPVTVFGVATALQRNPEIVAAMKEAGWDIASHSLKWIEHKDMSEDEERREIVEAIRVHSQVIGTRPLGWYTGRSSTNTVRLLMEVGGFMYLCDSYADDLPYWINGPSKPQLIIPYTLDANDMRFVNAQGFAGSDDFFMYLRDSFDVLYDEGTTSPKMMSVGLHCRLVGRPGRMAALTRFLDYVERHDRVWVPTRLQIAEHWHASLSHLAADAHAIL
jgi:putative urate catabolism protein